MARVLLNNVNKVFDDETVAIQDLSIDVTNGEFMVIVGPSGCGKTTILRMIAGLEQPTSGTIEIDGAIVNDVSPKDRDIAMVFQNYALYPHMTAFQNMAFGLKLRKCPKTEIKKRVAETAGLLGIKELLKRKPKALSGGQRQRVALGRSIVRKPRLFLFDEPLSNLDAKARIITRAELKTLHQKLKATSIYVTHDQSEAMMLGDRICVLHEGVIQQVAKPLEVYERPVNKFVAGFVGMPPMNFFNGRIDFEQDIPKFVMDSVKITLPRRIKDYLAAYQGKEMVLGVRPEHLSLVPVAGQSENIFSATIDVVEPLGDRTEVYLTSRCNQKFITTIDPYVRIKRGEMLTLCIDADRVHIFEPGDGEENVTISD